MPYYSVQAEKIEYGDEYIEAKSEEEAIKKFKAKWGDDWDTFDTEKISKKDYEKYSE